MVLELCTVSGAKMSRIFRCWDRAVGMGRTRPIDPGQWGGDSDFCPVRVFLVGPLGLPPLTTVLSYVFKTRLEASSEPD
jgi:hypothetical protein